MSTYRTLALASLAALSMQAGMSATAEAKIDCDGPYQMSSGYPIRTPYCEDNYLAQVARGHGMAVSGAEVRQSYNLKRDVCQVVGYDTRVSEICIGVRRDGSNKIWTP